MQTLLAFLAVVAGTLGAVCVADDGGAALVASRGAGEIRAVRIVGGVAGLGVDRLAGPRRGAARELHAGVAAAARRSAGGIRGATVARLVVGADVHDVGSVQRCVYA